MKRYIHSSKDINSKHSVRIYCMAVATKSEFNIPYDVWIDRAANTRKVAHNLPRVKADVDGNKVPFSVEDEPRLLVRAKVKHENEIIKWIKLNKDVLLRQWNGEISDKEALTQLRKLK